MYWIDITEEKPVIGESYMIYNKIGDWYDYGVYHGDGYFYLKQKSPPMKATHFLIVPKFK